MSVKIRDDNKLVTCKQCEWVHFEVSLEYAKEQTDKFNEYYNSLDPETKCYYSGPVNLEREYMKCFLCGGSYKNFRDYIKGDCPDGCTIQPIVCRDE